jgi:hypothetical protein
MSIVTIIQLEVMKTRAKLLLYLNEKIRLPDK